MKYYDSHLHLPGPDLKGLDALLQHLESEKDMVGGNLILNRQDEMDFACTHRDRLPSSLQMVPLLDPDLAIPAGLAGSGWFKLHPGLSRVAPEGVSAYADWIAALTVKLKGLIVHCYPWGPHLRYNVSLPLVIELALKLPEVVIVASHGGGYESWQFRAHAGGLKNVYFDFSVTMSYYSGSPLLMPFQRYLRHSPERILFGSDWPYAGCAEQLAECLRLAQEVGVLPERLEAIFLENARRLWP